MGWKIFGKKKTETLPVREKMSTEEKRFRKFGSWKRLLHLMIKQIFAYESNSAEQYSVEAKYLNNLFQEGLLPVNFPEMVLKEFKSSVHYGNLVREKVDQVDFVEKVNTHRQNLKTLLDFNDDQVDEVIREIMQDYFNKQEFVFVYYLHFDHGVSLDEQSMSLMYCRVYEHFVMRGDLAQVEKMRESGMVDQVIQNNNRATLILQIFRQLHRMQLQYESPTIFQKHEFFRSSMVQLKELFVEATKEGYLDLRGLLLALMAGQVDCLPVVENLDAGYQEKIPKEMWPQLALLHCQVLAWSKFAERADYIREIERTIKQYEIKEAFRSWYRQGPEIYLNPVLLYRL